MTELRFAIQLAYGRIKGRLGTMSKFQKPTFNVVLPFSSILAAAEIHGVTFRGWEIRARFPAPLSSPSAPPEPPFHHPCPIIGEAFIAFSCRRVLRSSLIFMQGLHDRTRISPGKRFPSSLFPPTRRWLVFIRRQLSLFKLSWNLVAKKWRSIIKDSDCPCRY